MEEKTVELIVFQYGIKKEEVKPESDFRDDFGADSLDLVEMEMAIEEEFGFEINDKEWTTVGECFDYIKERVK